MNKINVVDLGKEENKLYWQDLEQGQWFKFHTRDEYFHTRDEYKKDYLCVRLDNGYLDLEDYYVHGLDRITNTGVVVIPIEVETIEYR